MLNALGLLTAFLSGGAAGVVGPAEERKKMIRRYIQAAMEHARYEILQDDKTYYGEIKECPGVYSNAPTLEQCRSELEEVLEEWILFRVYKNPEIPPVDMAVFR
jgi:predicted RNase H-like HicB family nuclease